MAENSALHDAVTAARDAMAAGRLAEAEAAWRGVRRDFPLAPAGFLGLAKVLRRQKRGGEADAVLEEGVKALPRHEKLALDYAQAAHQRADWAAARDRWAALRAAFPDAPEGYAQGAAALRGLADFAQAEALLAQALQRWPDAANLLADHAALAQARGDQAEAARRWAVLRARAPGGSESFMQEARAWRRAGETARAEEVLQQAAAAFPDSAEPLVELAQIATARGDTLEALRRWEKVATGHPSLRDGYLGATNALNDLGRFADAQNVLMPALRLFPGDTDILALNAWTAHYRGAFAEAAERWAALRASAPQLSVGWTGGAISLSAQGQSLAATALMDEAVARFADDVNVAIEWARQAQRVQEWEDAEHRWRRIAGRFPNRPRVATGFANVLSRNGKTAEAEEFLAGALQRMPGEPTLLRAHAECASARSAWNESVARWELILERLPGDVANWCGLAAVLRDAGRLDRSEAVGQQALTRFPASLEVQRQLALTATVRRDWAVALPRWAALKRQYPGSAEVRGGIVNAIWQARQDQGVAQAEGKGFEIPPILLETGESADGEALRALFMRFETLGDTCEFGIVQRRFGAEPISLLRWSSTPPHHLTTALQTRFEGVGSPEHTIIEVVHGEYVTRDRRYHMFSHTYTPETAEPMERFAKAHLRRIQYLRRKLVDDLTEGGDKIYVYKCNNGLSDAQAAAIFEAMRAYGGGAPLLCVRIADADHAAGTLETARDGLFIGYTDRFSTIDINVDNWISLCRQAAALCPVPVSEAAEASA